MYKTKTYPFALMLILCFLLTQPAMSQTQKTFKETMADLKKSFHPDKAFILPFSDSTNEDLQAFLFSVQQTKGVNDAKLKMKDGKAVITVDTKNSMVTVWDNLEKEFHNRYTVTDRTNEGFILADSYQTGATQNSSANQQQTETKPPIKKNKSIKN